LMDMRPDCVLIGAWNFRDEIVALLRTQYGYRGDFIMPLPIPELVESGA
jgi:hypothetical protein